MGSGCSWTGNQRGSGVRMAGGHRRAGNPAARKRGPGCPSQPAVTSELEGQQAAKGGGVGTQALSRAGCRAAEGTSMGASGPACFTTSLPSLSPS